MRTLVIHNPKSGFGSDAIFQFMRALVHPGDECVLRMLADDFTSEEVCAHIDGFDTIVVSGGDGTVSTLLHAMRGRTTPVCVFPSGTGNAIGNRMAPNPNLEIFHPVRPNSVYRMFLSFPKKRNRQNEFHRLPHL